MTSVRSFEASFQDLYNGSCGSRLAAETSFGALCGVVLAAWDVTVIAPPRGGAAAAFAGSVARRVPVKAGLCAAYSAVSCFVRDARGRDDWVSDAAGGAAAGAVVFAMKGASAATFLGGMLVFAAGAASPAIMARMSPTVEETARRRAAPHAGLTGAAYAKAPLAAEGVARRLL